jgi:hypothetical protein
MSDAVTNYIVTCMRFYRRGLDWQRDLLDPYNP